MCVTQTAHSWICVGPPLKTVKCQSKKKVIKSCLILIVPVIDSLIVILLFTTWPVQHQDKQINNSLFSCFHIQRATYWMRFKILFCLLTWAGTVLIYLLTVPFAVYNWMYWELSLDYFKMKNLKDSQTKFVFPYMPVHPYQQVHSFFFFFLNYFLPNCRQFLLC